MKVLECLTTLSTRRSGSRGGSTYDTEGHGGPGSHIEGAGSSSARVALVASHLVGAEVLDGGVALEVGGGTDVLPVAATGASASADPGDGVYIAPCQYVL